MDIIINSIITTLGNTYMWFILAGIFFFTGMTKGGIGNGLGALTIIFLSLVIDPMLALGLTLLIFLMSDIIGIITWWKKWDTKHTFTALRWVIIGITLGTIFLIPIQQGKITTDALKFLLALLGLYLTLRWYISVYIRKQSHSTLSAWEQRGLCITGGFTSATLNSGGIPMMTYALSLGLEKQVMHATTVFLFGMINTIKFIPYVGLGIVNMQTIYLALSFFPIVLLGVITGKFLHHRIEHNLFNIFAYTGVVLSSTKLLYDIFT